MEEELYKAMMDYAKDMEEIEQLRQLRSFFTTYCLVDDIEPDTFKADMTLVELWDRIVKIFVMENPDYLKEYRNADYIEAYLHHDTEEQRLEEAYENFMYEDLLLV